MLIFNPMQISFNKLQYRNKIKIIVKIKSIIFQIYSFLLNPTKTLYNTLYHNKIEW